MYRLLVMLGVSLMVSSTAFAHDRDHWGGGRWNDHRGVDRPGWSHDRWDSHRDPKPQTGFYGNPSRYSYNRNPDGYRGNPVGWGISSGRLTPNEIRDLNEDVAAIRRKEGRYLADGHLSASERNDLRGDWKDYDKGLQHNLNDGERRW